MKKEKPGIFLLFIFFISIHAMAQPERFTGTIHVKKPADLLPRIAGKTQGIITPGELCNSQGIYVTKPGIKIIAFEITYFSSKGESTHNMEGNKMNEEICADFQRMKNNDQVHIYNILAEDELGRKFSLEPLRFSVSLPEVEKIIFFSGFYQQKLDYIPIIKKYIKIGNPESYNSGAAWIINSAGEPVVLNQVFENNYRTDGIVHGRYSIIDNDSIIIDFDPQYSDADFRGSIKEGKLELYIVSHDGQIYDQTEKYIILPFSRMNR